MPAGLASLCAAFAPAVAQAQQAATTDRAASDALPPWLSAWSPLAPLADQPRTLARAPFLPDLQTAPAPRVGLFWTAANPAALARDVADTTDRFTQFRFAAGQDEGTYRRPLDAERAVAGQLSAFGWQPLGRRGAAIGRVVVDREEHDRGSWAVAALPYGSSPLVVTDSSQPGMQRVRARLEGALAWRLRGWSVGFAPGLEASEHRSSRAQVPRTIRVAAPALAVGVTRELPIARLRVGAHARLQRSDETVLIVPLAKAGTVFQLEGYGEPDPLVFPQLAYYRRAERRARAIGAGVSGRVFGAAWVVSGEQATRRDANISDPTVSAATDRWDVDARTVDLAARRRFVGDRALVTLTAGWGDLTGAATRADLSGDIFRASEQRTKVDADVRFVPRTWAWSFGTRVGTHREHRLRRDFVARRTSEIVGWTPGGAVEVARRMGGGIDIAAGYARAWRAPVSRIPDPAGLGEVYRRLVGPEQSLEATPATPSAMMLTVRRQPGGGTGFFLRLHRETTVAGATVLPLAPVGDRSLWRVTIGTARIGR